MQYFSFRKHALALLILAVTSISPVCASTFFNFTESGVGISASGVLTTTDNGNGSYTITDIVGKLNGAAITLIAPGMFQDNDNLLFVPAAPGLLDVLGFAYATTAGSFNIYYDFAGAFVTPGSYASYNGTDTVIDFSITAVPEISTWAMMLFGFASVALLAHRRKSKPIPRIA